MPELSVEQLLLVAVFIVPGAISAKVYEMKFATKRKNLAEILPETIVFSIVNFSLLFWAIDYALRAETIQNETVFSYLIILACLFVAPVMWPFILFLVLKFLIEKLKWLPAQEMTSWDYFFNREAREKGVFVILRLSDDSYVAGIYGANSFASSFPDPGHIYLETLMEVNGDGYLTGRRLEGVGMLLRPGDYKSVKVAFEPN
ncbi:MAG: DUF6338 family protein [Nitrososphaera sp.]|nr:DUF6338 family protein [Nitrososphaera sp.]